MYVGKSWHPTKMWGGGVVLLFSLIFCGALEAQPVTLAQGAPQTVSQDTAYSIGNYHNGWTNVLAVSGNDDWDIGIGSGATFTSSALGGDQCDFLVSFENTSNVDQIGAVVRFSGNRSAQIEHDVAPNNAVVGAGSGSSASLGMSSDSIVSVFELHLLAAGDYQVDISATNASDLTYHFF